MGKYDFEEIKAVATKFNATAEDRLSLLDWMKAYDNGSWDGESYDLGDGTRLYPIEEGVGEPDGDGDYEQYQIVDCDIR